MEAQGALKQVVCCSLGRLYLKVLKDEERGVAYHRQCLELAHSLVPVPLCEPWFQVLEDLPSSFARLGSSEAGAIPDCPASRAAATPHELLRRRPSRH